MMDLMCSFGSVVQTIWHVLLAFVILMIMVTIHEFGHYSAGKLLKFKINEFSVGMGPKVFSHTKKDGEVFSLRLLPLGGYCAFEGEDEENESEGAFNKQAPWKRLIVLFCGAFFNFLSALLVCAILFGCYGETVAKVGTVFGYADESVQTLSEDDIIYEINGRKVFIIDSLSRYMSKDDLTIKVLKSDGTFKTITAKKGTFTNAYLADDLDTDLVLKEYEDGTKITLTSGTMVYKISGNILKEVGDFEKYLNSCGSDAISLTVYASDGNFYDVSLSKSLLSVDNINESTYTGLGISPSYGVHKYGWRSLGRIFPYCCETGLVILRSLGGIFTGATSVNDLGGPITTISTITTVVSYGFSSVLLLIVLISVNLAVFNLLPVPALDGCRMVFVIIEWIRKKPLNRKVEAYINGIGLIVLIALMILIDLLKL